MERYRVGAKLGEGCFGAVYAAVDGDSGARVALKIVPLRRLLQDGLPDAAVRELLSLRLLADSPHVVRLLAAFPCSAALVLVMEPCAADYGAVLRGQPGWARLPLAAAKCLADQLLAALADVHRRGVVHRDVKPGNVLLDDGGGAKLGDFGLARLLDSDGGGGGGGSGGDWTHEVATRWYRAPELLFGARRYGAAVDVWGAGCVIAELVSGGGSGVLFPGTGDIDQIARIFHVLGTPRPSTHPTITALPDWGKVEFTSRDGVGLAAVLPEVDPAALDLLAGLLAVDPSRRVSAAEARRHPFFFTPPLPCEPQELRFPPPPPRPPAMEAVLAAVRSGAQPTAPVVDDSGPVSLWRVEGLPFQDPPP